MNFAENINEDYVVIESKNQNELNMTPSGKLLANYIRQEGPGDSNIEVYDNWISKNVYGNISGRMLAFKDGRIVTFEELKVIHPRYTREGKVLQLTPMLAREQGVTYGVDLMVDLVMRQGDGKELDRKRNVCIGNLPVMLKSSNCVLHGKNSDQLKLLGEDPKDPGGYFIISGVEKIVLLQEQLAVNKIFLMNMSTKSSVVARMTAITPKGTALTELALDKKTNTVLKIRFQSLRGNKQDEKYKSINVLRVFRLYEISDKNQILNLIKLFIRQEYQDKALLKLTNNLVDFEVFPDDIEILASKMDKSKLSLDEKRDEINKVLTSDLFPHLNSLLGQDNETAIEKNERIRNSKLYLLAIMIARLLEYMAGYRKLDDRDSWSNKRVEGAARMMEGLLRNAWRKTVDTVQTDIEKGTCKTLNEVNEKIRSSVITDTFHDSFITSNWGVKGSQMKNNVAQTLVRDSVVATFAHINTVDVSVSRTDRQESLRVVQNSQWGFVDPVSTPEGENAGILKNLAITAKVSLERQDNQIIRYLIGDGLKNLDTYVINNFPNKYNWIDKIIVNGKFLGWCDGDKTYDFLIMKRRTGQLPIDMSVIRETDWIYVDIGPSRLIRPLLIVDKNQQLVIDQLSLRNQPNHILFNEGAMEYISAWEQEYIKIALSVDDINNRLKLIRDVTDAYQVALANIQALGNSSTSQARDEAQNDYNNALETYENLKNNKPYTHCELDAQAILGVAAALIPWANHNQAPRNTYQVSMGKQALGEYHDNHKNRFDGKTKLLAFPKRPVVETQMYDIIGLNEKGAGENVTIAFMAYPYTEEDSFIFKKEFLDNGGLRIYKYLVYKTVVKHSGEIIEKLGKPEHRVGEPADRYKFIQQADVDSPLNGLPMIGAFLRQGDCVIGKMQYIPSTKDSHNESSILRVGDEGIVDKVLVTSDNKTTVVTVKLRVMRTPQEGDKFAPRNAQKGTMGLVVSDINMPFNKDGISPDIIVNTHSIPSRMTMSYIMELLASKHAAFKGTHINGSSFAPFELQSYRQTLKDYNSHPFGQRYFENLQRVDSHNYFEFGYEFMRSGTSGKPLKIPINFSPVYFQALKHHVRDKIQVRNTGPVKPMTRQPPKGRGNRGGLRFGEMERDAAISHGASSFLRERLMLVSDAYQTAFCKNCGTFAIYDATTRLYKPCRLCNDETNFGRFTIPYAYKLLIHLLAAIGINLRPEFLTSDEYADKLFRNRPSPSGDINDISAQLNEADEFLTDEQLEINEEQIDEDSYADYSGVYD